MHANGTVEAREVVSRSGRGVVECWGSKGGGMVGEKTAAGCSRSLGHSLTSSPRILSMDVTRSQGQRLRWYFFQTMSRRALQTSSEG